jgi:hypothetical protein
MNLTKLARIERLQNKLAAKVRDHLERYTNKDLLEMAEFWVTEPDGSPPMMEQALISITYLNEIVRRVEANTMGGVAYEGQSEA